MDIKCNILKETFDGLINEWINFIDRLINIFEKYFFSSIFNSFQCFPFNFFSLELFTALELSGCR